MKHVKHTNTLIKFRNNSRYRYLKLLVPEFAENRIFSLWQVFRYNSWLTREIIQLWNIEIYGMILREKGFWDTVIVLNNLLI